MTKSRLLAIFVLFVVPFFIYLLVSNQERISAEAKQDEQAKEETKAIGLPIKVTDDFDRAYYGRYDSKYRYVVISRGDGRDMAWGYVGSDGTASLCAGSDGIIFGKVQTPTWLYIDLRNRAANIDCK